jgi:hypothetical protein
VVNLPQNSNWETKVRPNIHQDFLKLIRRGPKVFCIITARWYHLLETNSDGFGNRILKKFDTRIHDQTVTQSKIKGGPTWVRGIN